MSLAIVELIARELLSRLEAMIDDDTEYPINVVEVIRPTRLGMEVQPQDRQIILTQGATEYVPELHCPGNPPAIARRQIFNIRCNLMTDETSDEPIDTTINQFVSDVTRAVALGNNWFNFGGYAIEAYFQDPEYISADGGLDGVNLPIAIVYRTSENDPTVARG